jgi:hypothetical protein
MQLLVVTLFLVIFSIDYLAHIAGLVHPVMTLLPELLSVVVTALVIGRLVQTKRFDLHIKYLVFFALLTIHLLNGVLISDTSTGSLVVGLRVYLKYLPFFFLPIVYPFTPRELKQQMGLLLFLLLLQLPLTLLQRFYLYPDFATGDVVRGSLPTGSFMSIILVSAIAVVFSLYLKRLISGTLCVVLFFLFFVPTTIGETKGALVLLPFAVLIPLLALRQSMGGLIRKLAAVGIVAGAALAVYSWVFEYTQTRFVGQEETIGEFFSSRERLAHYLAPRTAGMEPADERYGRVDRVVAALEIIGKDPYTMMVGLGIGSVTKSPLPLFAGDHEIYIDIGLTGSSFPYILLETGVLGALLWTIFLAMLFFDSKALSKDPGIMGAWGMAWMAVVVIVYISLFYKDIVPTSGVMYPFWFFTGHVLAARYRLQHAASPAGEERTHRSGAGANLAQPARP